MEEELVIEIKKVSIKNDKYLNVEYIETRNETRSTIKKESSQIIHKDLVEAFERLDVHLAMLCEMVDDNLIHSIEDVLTHESLLSKLKVTGITIGGVNEHEGVCIVGQRKLRGKKVLNLVTPFTKFEDEHSPYKFMSDLSSVIDDCIFESEQYIQGKCTPSNQLEMFDKEDGDNNYDDGLPKGSWEGGFADNH